MSCIHYKFKSALDYKTLTFDGLHISVADLKTDIYDKEKIGQTAFDLQLTNAQTKRVFKDDAELIPRNSSVEVARIPAQIKTKIPKLNAKNNERHTEGAVMRASASALQDPNVLLHGVSGTSSGHLAESSSDLTKSNATELEKLNLIKQISTAAYAPETYKRGKQTMYGGAPPPTYTCSRCSKPGHWIRNCPLTNVRATTGIPHSELMTTTPDDKNAYQTASGRYVVPIKHKLAQQVGKKERRAFEDDAPSNSPVASNQSVTRTVSVPSELTCQLCKQLFTDAVLVPCCGKSFCDQCIRPLLLESQQHDSRQCPNCHETITSIDQLYPNGSVRDAVQNFTNLTGYAHRAQSSGSKTDQSYKSLTTAQDMMVIKLLQKQQAQTNRVNTNTGAVNPIVSQCIQTNDAQDSQSLFRSAMQAMSHRPPPVVSVPAVPPAKVTVSLPAPPSHNPQQQTASPAHAPVTMSVPVPPVQHSTNQSQSSSTVNLSALTSSTSHTQSNTPSDDALANQAIGLGQSLLIQSASTRESSPGQSVSRMVMDGPPPPTQTTPIIVPSTDLSMLSRPPPVIQSSSSSLLGSVEMERPPGVSPSVTSSTADSPAPGTLPTQHVAPNTVVSGSSSTGNGSGSRPAAMIAPMVVHPPSMPPNYYPSQLPPAIGMPLQQHNHYLPPPIMYTRPGLQPQTHSGHGQPPPPGVIAGMVHPMGMAPAQALMHQAPPPGVVYAGQQQQRDAWDDFLEKKRRDDSRPQVGGRTTTFGTSNRGRNDTYRHRERESKSNRYSASKSRRRRSRSRSRSRSVSNSYSDSSSVYSRNSSRSGGSRSPQRGSNKHSKRAKHKQSSDRKQRRRSRSDQSVSPPPANRRTNRNAGNRSRREGGRGRDQYQNANELIQTNAEMMLHTNYRHLPAHQQMYTDVNPSVPSLMTSSFPSPGQEDKHRQSRTEHNAEKRHSPSPSHHRRRRHSSKEGEKLVEADLGDQHDSKSKVRGSTDKKKRKVRKSTDADGESLAAATGTGNTKKIKKKKKLTGEAADPDQPNTKKRRKSTLKTDTNTNGQAQQKMDVKAMEQSTEPQPLPEPESNSDKPQAVPAVPEPKAEVSVSIELLDEEDPVQGDHSPSAPASVPVPDPVPAPVPDPVLVPALVDTDVPSVHVNVDVPPTECVSEVVAPAQLDGSKFVPLSTERSLDDEPKTESVKQRLIKEDLQRKQMLEQKETPSTREEPSLDESKQKDKQKQKDKDTKKQPDTKRRTSSTDDRKKVDERRDKDRPERSSRNVEKRTDDGNRDKQSDKHKPTYKDTDTDKHTDKRTTSNTQRHERTTRTHTDTRYTTHSRSRSPVRRRSSRDGRDGRDRDRESNRKRSPADRSHKRKTAGRSMSPVAPESTVKRRAGSGSGTPEPDKEETEREPQREDKQIKDKSVDAQSDTDKKRSKHKKNKKHHKNKKSKKSKKKSKRKMSENDSSNGNASSDTQEENISQPASMSVSLGTGRQVNQTAPVPNKESLSLTTHRLSRRSADSDKHSNQSQTRTSTFEPSRRIKMDVTDTDAVTASARGHSDDGTESSDFTDRASATKHKTKKDSVFVSAKKQLRQVSLGESEEAQTRSIKQHKGNISITLASSSAVTRTLAMDSEPKSGAANQFKKVRLQWNKKNVLRKN